MFVLPMRRSPKRVKRVPRHASDLTSFAISPLGPLMASTTTEEAKDPYHYNLMPTSRSRAWHPRHQMIIVEVQMVWENKYLLSLRCKPF